MSKAAILGLSIVFLGGASFGQVKLAPPEVTSPVLTVPEAIAKVKSGDYGPVHLNLIAEAGASEAIPLLEEQFRISKDVLDKAKIAQTLIRLSDKDPAYWDFLSQLAMSAIESDAPDFVNRDNQGNDAHGLSPAFKEWSQKHSVAPDIAGEDAVYMFPAIVRLLGATKDPRAIPLLRQALHSRNSLIEIAAAKGLAQMHDMESVPLIIKAASNAPADAAALIAEPLAGFDDTEAQRAVDIYVPKEVAAALRQARAAGKNPIH